MTKEELIEAFNDKQSHCVISENDYFKYLILVPNELCLSDIDSVIFYLTEAKEILEAE